MKRVLILSTLLMLTGCTTVPVAEKFPDIPPEFEQDCGLLTPMDKNDKSLSDLMVTVTKNYEQYYVCRQQNRNWLDWYTQQKEIFDKAQALKHPQQQQSN